MELKGKFLWKFKVSFEKMIALGIGYDRDVGLIILVPFVVIGINIQDVDKSTHL